MRIAVGPVVPIAAILLVASCVSGAPPGIRLDAVSERQPALEWPSPPDPPRMRYLASVARPSDIGAQRSLVRRVVDAFTGANETHVRQPYGVAVDSAGRVYVADVAARGVHVFDPVRGRYQFRRAAGRTSFRSPVGVAADAVGNVYVADSELGLLVSLDPAGRERWRVSRGLLRPTGLAFDWRRGVLYVVDTQAHRIHVYDAAGQLRRSFGTRGTGDGELNFPTNIVVAPDGTLLVTDAMNFRIQAFAPDGSFLFQFGRHGDAVGDFARPKGVAVDSEGHIYVVEGLFDVVNIFDREGTLLLSFGGAGQGRGEFWLATGIAIDEHDRVYVSDSFNGRVQVFQYLAHGR